MSLRQSRVAVVFKENVLCWKSSIIFFLHSFHSHTAFFCSFLYLGRARQKTHSRLHEKCRPLNTNALALQSFINLNQCINNLWSYQFLFFKDFIQCHLCTTKTPRYYYISFVLFYKRTTWCTPIPWVQEEKIKPYKASVWESEVFSPAVCAVFGHRRLSFAKD